jgi:hypothetical protein
MEPHIAQMAVAVPVVPLVEKADVVPVEAPVATPVGPVG